MCKPTGRSGGWVQTPVRGHREPRARSIGPVRLKKACHQLKATHGLKAKAEAKIEQAGPTCSPGPYGRNDPRVLAERTNLNAAGVRPRGPNWRATADEDGHLYEASLVKRFLREHRFLASQEACAFIHGVMVLGLRANPRAER
jgi:hypothetical protein